MNNTSNYFEQTDTDGNNPLHLVSALWEIDNVPVTASAAELNALAILSSAALTMTWGGAFVTPVSAPLRYQKIGKHLFLTIPAITGSSTASAAIISQTALATALRPAVAKTGRVTVNDGTNIVSGKITLGTNGIITITKDLAGGAFADATAIGVISTDVPFLLL